MDKNLSITEKAGNRIRQLRAHAGLSQESLALSAGISTVYLGQLERGLKTPTIITIEKLCKVFQITLSEFFIFDDIDADEQYRLALNNIAASLRELPPDSAYKISLIIHELSQLNKA